MRKISVRLIIKNIAGVVLWSLLCFHFIILFTYQIPANPISHRYKVFLESYINPNFSQKWSLFSPNPANSNQTIQINFITYSNKKAKSSGWIDIVTPIINEKNNNYWTPSQRTLKFLNSCASNIIDLRLKIWEAETKGKIKIDTLKVQAMMNKYITQTQGSLGITNYSKIVYNRIKHQNKFDSVLVQYKVVDAFFPRFSKRGQDYFLDKNYKYTHISSNLIRLY